MATHKDIDTTLPSIVAELGSRYSKTRLSLTLIFHPDVSRIGEIAFLADSPGDKSWYLGRNLPKFSRQRQPNEGMPEEGEPLGDLYLSRKALVLSQKGGSIVLERDASACRAQVNGRELDHQRVLSTEELSAGVSLFLAHRVVLLLRHVPFDSSSRADTDTVDSGLLGSSGYIAQIEQHIAIHARRDQDVLIRGETGTGKELVARAIHQASARSSGEMISVNMSAIPVALAPSALFGSAKGAFTGADKAGIGYFEQAQGSSLFLDEIGDTPLEIQAQLLRALEQREIQPVGGAVRKVDVRIIAATDADIGPGSDFKSALRYRLAASEIVLQPIREHPEDIGELLLHFLREAFEQTDSLHVIPDAEGDRLEVAILAEIFHSFLRFSWPGNVRQLRNYAVQIAHSSLRSMVFPQHIRAELKGGAEDTVSSTPTTRKMESISQQEFLQAMAEAEYEPKKAALLLNVARTAIYRRIDETPELRIAGQISFEELREVMGDCGDNINEAARRLRVSRSGLKFRLRSFNSP